MKIWHRLSTQSLSMKSIQKRNSKRIRNIDSPILCNAPRGNRTAPPRPLPYSMGALWLLGVRGYLSRCPGTSLCGSIWTCTSKLAGTSNITGASSYWPMQLDQAWEQGLGLAGTTTAKPAHPGPDPPIPCPISSPFCPHLFHPLPAFPCPIPHSLLWWTPWCLQAHVGRLWSFYRHTRNLHWCKALYGCFAAACVSNPHIWQVLGVSFR